MYLQKRETERKRQKSESIDRENDPWNHNHRAMSSLFLCKKVVDKNRENYLN